MSIDLCVICEGHLLLGKRSNEPLKGIWFTPGGRIYKNEKWRDSLQRVALTELGLSVSKLKSFTLMGVWDHFYPNSMYDQSISTHYVNLPHYLYLNEKPIIRGDYQHTEFNWFDLEVIVGDDTFHPYIRNYADWLKSNR